MAKGDGSITKLDGGRWRVQISYGKDPITGKYKRDTKVVHGTKAEARKVRDQMRKERENGLVLDGSKLTFGEFSDYCIEQLEASENVGKAYLTGKKSRLRLICSHIGSMKLKDITPQVAEATLAAIKKAKVEELGGFRNSTLVCYRTDLKLVLQKACDYDFISRNPCDKVKVPVPEKVERKSLNAAEAADLLSCIDKREAEAYARIAKIEEDREKRGIADEPRTRLTPMATVSHVIGVRIGLATGMRRGEILGLFWDSVDLENKCITVCRSLSSKDGLKEPKTKAGVRTISIDGKTVQHLAKWKRIQATELRKIGIEQGGTTPVCCSGFGSLMIPEDFSNWFIVFRKNIGFPELKFHELRHTQATLLLGNGVDVKTVQHRLGHAQSSVTLDQYAHALPENDKKAADMVAVICGGGAQKMGRIIPVKTA